MDTAATALFSRTLGQLATERHGRGRLAMGGALVLLALWLVWFTGSRLAVYAVSDAARLEVAQSPVRVQVPVGGRLVATNLMVGRKVLAGETLAQLDVQAQRLDVGEQRARLSGLAPQIARLEAEIAHQIESRRTEEAAAAVAEAEARATAAQAREAAELAASQERRMTALAASGLIQAAELARAQSETRQKQAAAEALRLAGDRLAAAQRHQDAQHRVRLERLRGELAALRAEQATGAAAVERLEYEGQLRQIVAPVSGTLAEVATVSAGQVLDAGEAIATIVPDGGLRIVATFRPAVAFGRVRPGQPARLRLDGFPATQFGNIGAVVSSSASELRDGMVRVELALTQLPGAVPAQHGLPGTVEIEVEQLTPAALVLRTAGLRLAQGVHE